MLAALITLTPGRRSEFIDCQKRHSPHRGTSDYRFEGMLELNIGVPRASLPITGIHAGVA